MKKTMFTLVMCGLAANGWALPKVIFGGGSLDAPLVAGALRTVVGPLLQLEMSDGTVLALQRGAKFRVDESGILALAEGNLRVGPAGTGEVTVYLPQGGLTVAPLTAATITAGASTSTGKVYQGELVAMDRTFTHGEGFVMTPSAVHGTFSAAAAEAPAVDGAPENLAEIAPAAGDEDVQSAPVAKGNEPLRVGRVVASANAVGVTPPAGTPEKPAAPTPEPETPVAPEPEEPVVPTPEPETPILPEPETEEPVVEQPPVEEPEPQPEVPVVPEPEEPTTPEPEPELPLPEPEVPVVEVPTEATPVAFTRTGLVLASWSKDVGVELPDGKPLRAEGYGFERFADGTEGLTQMTTKVVPQTATLQRGTAVAMDVASHESTAGLGRWVGGELVTYRALDGTVLAENLVNLGTESLHYVWGEAATAVPVSGRVEYDLFSATQPTYTGSGAAGLSSDGAVFDGRLAIDFKPARSGGVGSYEFAGTVTMPQVEKAEDGSDVTRNVVYTLQTPGAKPITADSFKNMAVLNVTADAGALACAGSCQGTVNVGGFGVGMKDVGTIYAINPGAEVGVTGAALFTAAP